MPLESDSCACAVESRRCALSVRSSSNSSQSAPLQTSKTQMAVPARPQQYVALLYVENRRTRLTLATAKRETSKDETRQTSTRFPPRPARRCIRAVAWQWVATGLFRRLSQRPISIQPIQCRRSRRRINHPFLAGERHISSTATAQRL